MSTSDPGQTRPPRPPTPISAPGRALSHLSLPPSTARPGTALQLSQIPRRLRILPGTQTSAYDPPSLPQQASKRPEWPPRIPEGAYRAGAPSAVSWVRWGEVLAHARCTDSALACPSAGALQLVGQCLKGCAPAVLGVRAPSTVPTLQLVAIWGV